MVKWLHLSDVHECDKDGYHRSAMYRAVVEEVRGQAQPPDLVLFTGDLGFSGGAEDYRLLQERLIAPLKAVLPAECRLFTVPGNHDVDRRQVGKPRLWIVDEDERTAFQRVDAEGQRKRRGALLPRFEAYRAFEKEVADWNEDWLASERGSVCRIVQCAGQKVAVVGINTAWLAQDESDSGQLTAGRTMVEAALAEAEAATPDLLLVLGHHPLGSMTGEAPWADGNRIRLRLEQANAVYLHGHLHLGGQQRTGDPIQSALAIQAQSGFQAGDNRQWRNGLMWGEADPGTGELILTPKLWNDDFKAFVPDTDAIDPRFARQNGTYALSLPSKRQAPTPAEPAKPSASVADGWEIIDSRELEERTSQPPSTVEMSDWFDGQFARWGVAMAPGVRPRGLIDDLVRRFDAAHDHAPQPLAILLTGGGGEGKSTGLLQLAGGLLRGGKSWTCLYRSAAAATLPEDLLSRLERRPGHAWIIAVDDAENLADALPAALRSIQPRTDVHLALAARHADWSIRGVPDAAWRGVAAFSHATLAGLDTEDARRIAEGWCAYGDEAMGRLKGQTVEQAALSLLTHARERAARQEEGALLGALLITRGGEDLRARVIRLMEPWATAPGVNGRTLLDIYAMIAAMHAENQLYLSHTTLAYALGCEVGELERGPLRTLRLEAMVDGSSTYVLTRHRRIAEVARDWLVSSGYDIDRLYPFLARAALRQFLKARPAVNDIARWCHDLPEHFADRGPDRGPVAVAVAKGLFEENPTDPIRLTVYASMVRSTEGPGAALAILRQEAPRQRRERGVIYEWSVAAGGAGADGLDGWLGGRSLADDSGVRLELKQIKLSLAGLGLCFHHLYERTQEMLYRKAQAACGRLGLMLTQIDPRSRGYFENYVAALPSPAGNRPTSIDADLALMKAGIVAAAYHDDPDKDDPLFFETLLGDPEGYRFTALKQALLDEAGPSGVASRGGRQGGPARMRP